VVKCSPRGIGFSHEKELRDIGIPIKSHDGDAA